MVAKSFRWLKFANMMVIAAYLVMYIMAFSAYDASGVNFDEDTFEHEVLQLMAAVGIAFTCALVSNWIIYNKGRIIENIVCIACGIAQIPILYCAISAAEVISRYGLNGEDEIVKYHGDAAIFMAYAIIGIVSLYILLAIFSLMISTKNRKSKDENESEDVGIEYIDVPDFHKPVIIVLLITTAICVFSLYMLVGLMLAIPFFVAFAIPLSILLGTEVREWIEDKKYIPAAIVYLVYMYISYGAFYRLFSDELYGFYVRSSNPILLCVMQLVNIVIAGVVAVRLIVKAIKD